jgi:hypothetical protein
MVTGIGVPNEAADTRRRDGIGVLRRGPVPLRPATSDLKPNPIVRGGHPALHVSGQALFSSHLL